jgi:hypothetical protein
VAFATSFGVTGPLETIFDVIPIARMRVGHQTAFGAVTFETDIAIRMAGLAGGQIFPRFAGMIICPLMARQHRVGMTALALLIIEEGMIATEGAVGEAFTMGLKRQIGTIEVVVTLNTELAFMTFITELRIGTRRDGVGDGELGTVNIGHGVAKVPHLISPTSFVAVETITLFMTGRAIDALGHCRVAVSQRPGHVMGE